eukprot:499713-Pleurochrysis_carterae.AAC.1
MATRLRRKAASLSDKLINMLKPSYSISTLHTHECGLFIAPTFASYDAGARDKRRARDVCRRRAEAAPAASTSVIVRSVLTVRAPTVKETDRFVPLTAIDANG